MKPHAINLSNQILTLTGVTTFTIEVGGAPADMEGDVLNAERIYHFGALPKYQTYDTVLTVPGTATVTYVGGERSVEAGA